MSDEYTIQSDTKIARLEKRGRGLRRLLTAISDLPLYGIMEATDPNLIKQLETLKEKLKEYITENNKDLAIYYIPNDINNTDSLQNEINNAYINKGI